MYQTVIAHFQSVFADPDTGIEIKLAQFDAGIRGAVFLFDSDVVFWLKELRLKTIALRKNNTSTEDAELLTWFGDQFELAEMKFQPYLQFRRVL